MFTICVESYGRPIICEDSLFHLPTTGNLSTLAQALKNPKFQLLQNRYLRPPRYLQQLLEEEHSGRRRANLPRNPMWTARSKPDVFLHDQHPRHPGDDGRLPQVWNSRNHKVRPTRCTAICRSTAPTCFYHERHPHPHQQPVSASKASADLLVLGITALRLPVISAAVPKSTAHIPRKKLIQLMIANALGGKPLPVYGTGENFRDWLSCGGSLQRVALIVRKRARRGGSIQCGRPTRCATSI